MTDHKLDYIQERVDIVVDRVADVSKSVEGLKTIMELHIAASAPLQEQLVHISTTLRENTSSLREHVRRTNLLEEYITSVDKRFTPIEMESTRKRAVNGWIYAKVKFIGKLGAAISAVGALGLVAKQVIQYLSALH